MADSKKIDDGGYAFPASSSTFGIKGMTLRDWFAGQALAGQLANPNRVGNQAKFAGWAEQSYYFADAMIAARKADRDA